MNITEIKKACDALAAEIGPSASIYFNCAPHISASLYTKGICGKNEDISSFTVSAQGAECDFSPEKMLGKIRERYAIEAEKRGIRIIEEMALEVIRLTAEFGTCTDSALRAKYGPLVSAHGAAAVDKANEMASNGPFSIETVVRSNAA